jgi:hypothetical protein
MREGTSGIDASLVPQKVFMDNIVCSDCHLYSTGPPQNLTGHSFSFKEEACAACHTNNPLTIDLSVDEAGASVRAVQTETQTLQTQVITDLANANSMIDNATKYGFDIATIDLAEDYYEEASYSLDFVIADKSQGAHNPLYAWALLNFAADRSSLIKSMLLPGTVTGEAVDSDGKGVAGVIVRRGGLDLAISGADGDFTFEYASGTYDFSLVKDGELVGTIENLTIEGGLTVSAGENEISFSTPFDWSIPLLAIIAMLVIVVAFLAFKQFGGKQKEEESSEEQEEEEKEEESSSE